MFVVVFAVTFVVALDCFVSFSFIDFLFICILFFILMHLCKY